MPANLDILAAKRCGVWHHALRNRKVARLAQAFRAGRVDELRQLLPAIEHMESASCPNGVVVLVENIEHALAPRAYLLEHGVESG
ncbi:MAG TPA: hypothetical protein VH682_05500 [Gemmataceae bacterium]